MIGSTQFDGTARGLNTFIIDLKNTSVSRSWQELLEMTLPANKKLSTTNITMAGTKINYLDARETKWNYKSIVGKLSYLCRNTRPYIEFAVHQCARFRTNPKQSHEKAIKRICRYLLKTKDKGITIKLSNDLTKLDCYVDANFMGAYTPSESHDPTLCRSRTGYVIMYANCPVLWASKLQMEIALSTVEAE